MKLKNINKAFTLIELLVGIAIIGIIILGATNIDYNRLTTKQKLDIFANSVKSSFETVRNNALTGKGIGTNLDVPKNIKIEYSNESSGSILISTSLDGITWSGSFSIDFEEGYNIGEMRCLELNGDEDSVITGGTGTIMFEGINITLTGACLIDAKVLEIPISYRSYTKKLEINTLNGLAEFK